MAFKRSFAVLFLLAASVLASPRSSGGPDSCGKEEFYHPPIKQCLHKGGEPSPPGKSSPILPPNKSCPPFDWYWKSEYNCCVPKHPPPSNSPQPQCGPGNEWVPATQCCEPGGGTPTSSTHKPSQTPYNPYNPQPPQGGYPGYNPLPPNNGYNPSPPKNPYGGHNYKKRSPAPLCPRSYVPCTIAGLPHSESEYECVDSNADLKSCGGCASTGEGVDCTTIPNVGNVGCEQGSCAVYTCKLGYHTNDGKSCIED